MKRSGIHGFSAAIIASAVLLSGAAPALAHPYHRSASAVRHTPVLVDAVLLRPVGLALAAACAVAFIPVAAVVGMIRPTDINKPFHYLIVVPFRYTFLDPLGEHPPTRLLDQ